METTDILKSDIRVVAIDENYWTEEIAKACGNIQCVYIYDASVQIRLCEVTPSYELIPLYYITENEISDELHSQMMNEDMDVMYVHCYQVDKMESISANNDIEFESSDSEEYKEHFEEVKEYVNCNHLI